MEVSVISVFLFVSYIIIILFFCLIDYKVYLLLNKIYCLYGC